MCSIEGRFAYSARWLNAWAPPSLPEGERVFDACEVVSRSGRPGRELYQDRNHLTVEGNRLVGEALAAYLAELR